jgi:E3 ubiquitin-protein ligase HECTD2
MCRADKSSDVHHHVAVEHLHSYYLLLHNPLFDKSTTYVVFAMLLRQVATLGTADANTLSQWFSK